VKCAELVIILLHFSRCQHLLLADIR